MRSDRIRLLVETALTVALCAALNFWRIKLPWNIAGGDISLAMLPIFVLALRRGLVPAMIAGLVWGTLDFLYEPYAVAPIQVLLDATASSNASDRYRSARRAREPGRSPAAKGGFTRRCREV